MGLKRIAAAAAVAVGLAGSGLLVSQAWSDPSPAVSASVHSRVVSVNAVAVPASVDPTEVSMDAVVARAADKAALVMMCEKGRVDVAAEASYRATVQAHPDVAANISSDCRIVSVAP